MEKNNGEQAVKLARKAIENLAESGKKISAKYISEEFSEKRGIFVTIYTYPKKELRGCIGFPEPVLPLVDGVIEAAVSAARDPRFPPLEKNELGKVTIEVSVLSKPVLIDVKNPKEYLKNINLGKDGLILEKGRFKGLLLPQVPLEWNWDKETYLGNLCVKADLSPNQWLSEGVKIFKFQAEIFAEEYPRGSVKKVGYA